jgi:hypothetical protein
LEQQLNLLKASIYKSDIFPSDARYQMAAIAYIRLSDSNVERMTGQMIDTLMYFSKSIPPSGAGFFYLDTDFGKIRVFDTQGHRPVIVNVPDAPNVIEHQIPLIYDLAKDYRVICFEYPGSGFSFPNSRYNYSFDHGSRLLIQVMDSLQVDKVSLLYSCSNGYYAMQAAMAHAHRFHHIFPFAAESPASGTPRIMNPQK